jgi:hypothetical protein
MFEKPPRHFPSEFLWWVVVFTTAVTLVEVWMRDYQDAAFHATLTLLLVVHVRTEGRPAGWLRVTQWSLVALMPVLFVLRVMRWTGSRL